MKKMTLLLNILFLVMLMGLIESCAPTHGGGDTVNALPDTAKTDPSNPSQAPVPPQPVDQTSGPRTYAVDVLLFNGTGISTSDWQTTEQIVKSMGLTYRLVNSDAMNAMTLDEMANFGLMIFPGGHRDGIMSGLNSDAQLRIRQAVRDRGVSYLGICAGAFAAVGNLANTDTTSENDLGVVQGTHLSNWWPNGNTSAVAAVVPVKFSDSSIRYLVWWGGPKTPEWTGGVVARYNDGAPAISETFFQKGFIVLSAVHPEAPQGWRNTAGNDPDGLDYDIAKKLITAALERKPLPAY